MAPDALRGWICWAMVWLALFGAEAAAEPPRLPVILEPTSYGADPGDVHMATRPFVDPDGDAHQCSDWEILTAAGDLAWSASCTAGPQAVHTHLGDGVFSGAFAADRRLGFSGAYVLRVRHLDDRGEVSDWATQAFGTAEKFEPAALELDDVVHAPAPRWIQGGERRGVVLPAGSPAASLQLESEGGERLLGIRGADGLSNEIVNERPLPWSSAVCVRLEGGERGFSLEASSLVITNPAGREHAVYLPALTLGPRERARFWVGVEGSTYIASDASSVPDFATIARGSPIPWNAGEPGWGVQVVATGFQLPVNIAFVPNAGPLPTDVWFYVTELYGTVKAVTREGRLVDFATGLLNFNPLAHFPGSGELGLTGLAVEPSTGDVFVSLLWSTDPRDVTAPLYPKILRLHRDDSGLTASRITTVIAMPAETQGASHQISNLSIGPDGMLYVHMGDGFFTETAQDLGSLRGKILRLNLDGSAPADNPYFEGGATGSEARDYIYAYGFRNPFGGAWRAADDSLYEVENGASIDRLAKVVRGRNYHWDGSEVSMRNFATYNWQAAPVNIAFIQPETFGGSLFPPSKMGSAFVTESGPTYAPGPTPFGKRISEFRLDESGRLMANPTTFVEYGGSGRATAAALAAGPDGLYFSDFYQDLDAPSPVARGANVLRVSFVGAVDFSAAPAAGAAPLRVELSDRSNVREPTSWSWDFGDGETGHGQTTSHVYNADGIYDVRLTITSAGGERTLQRDGFVVVGDGAGSGLAASYYAGANFETLKLERVDPAVNFGWSRVTPPPVEGGSFSVFWRGTFEPRFSERYTLHALTQGGSRVWVDGALVVDDRVERPLREAVGEVSLRAGERHAIVAEYTYNTGRATARLLWSSASQPKEVVPARRLFPPVDGTPPLVVPSVLGTLGDGGWYTSDVTLRWAVSDAESEIVLQEGCETVVMATDTPATTVTCSATSLGGKTSVSVRARRDATPPLFACPGDFVVPAQSAEGAVVRYGLSPGDALDPTPSAVAEPPPGSVFPVGATRVRALATDAAGNRSACSFQVTVTPLPVRPEAANGCNVVGTSPDATWILALWWVVSCLYRSRLCASRRVP